MTIKIRKANVGDAKGIADIINSVVDEKKYTSLRKFNVDEEREYINSLNEREAIFVAIKDGKIVGFQTISLFAKGSESTSHVGNILTLILKEYRGQGIGKLLAERTLEFARQNGYEKIFIYIFIMTRLLWSCSYKCSPGTTLRPMLSLGFRGAYNKRVSGYGEFFYP